MPDPQSFEQIRTLNNRTEMPKASERTAERVAERSNQVAAPRPLQSVPVAVTLARPMPQIPTSAKSETLVEIESVMESGLADVYKTLPPDLQKAFKKRGEETAGQIEELLQKVKVHTKKIFSLLFDWLKIIPGVNKYFLEQEAKLKTDEMLKIKETLEQKRKETKLI